MISPLLIRGKHHLLLLEELGLLLAKLVLAQVRRILILDHLFMNLYLSSLIFHFHVLSLLILALSFELEHVIVGDFELPLLALIALVIYLIT